MSNCCLFQIMSVTHTSFIFLSFTGQNLIILYFRDSLASWSALECIFHFDVYQIHRPPPVMDVTWCPKLSSREKAVLWPLRVFLLITKNHVFISSSNAPCNSEEIDCFDLNRHCATRANHLLPLKGWSGIAPARVWSVLLRRGYCRIRRAMRVRDEDDGRDAARTAWPGLTSGETAGN